MPSVPLPPGYAVTSPVLRIVVPREAIARIPETEGVTSLFRGLVVELPVWEGASYYAGVVTVNGYPYGVLYFPQELRNGRIMALKVPLRYYDILSEQRKDQDKPYLDIEVFALRPEPEEPREVQGLPIGCSSIGCSGLYKKDNNTWRWFLRIAKAVPVSQLLGQVGVNLPVDVTIPAGALREGQPEPIRVVFVHGLAFGYSIAGGWIGPKPDQWDSFLDRIKQRVGNTDLVGYYAYTHSGGGGFTATSRDLKNLMRKVNDGQALSSRLPRADIEVMIGHSMGGLIIRSYAHEYVNPDPWPQDPKSRVARVVTLASPYHGSYMADLGLQIIMGDDHVYIQRLAEYIVRKAGFQCGWGFLQELAQYVDAFKVPALDLGVTLPGVGQLTLENILPMQSLMELTYDWFAPLMVYIPNCGRVVLSPGDPDFPAALRMGQATRDLMNRERGRRGYIYNYYVKEFGGGNRLLGAASMLLAMFHNDPSDYPGQPQVVPSRRFNDGVVWYRSGRGDGCCGSFIEVRQMPNARDHFQAKDGDDQVLQWVADRVKSIVEQWRSRFSGYRMFALVWGKAPDLNLINLNLETVTDVLSGIYTTNLDLMVWPVSSSAPTRALPVFPEPGFAENFQAGVIHMGDASEGGPERIFLRPKAGYTYYFVAKKVHNGFDVGFGPAQFRFDVPLNGDRARFVVFNPDYTIQRVYTPSDWGCSRVTDLDACTQDPTEDENDEPGGPGEEYWVIGKFLGGSFQLIDQSVEAVDTTIVERLGNGMCLYRTALKWPGPGNTYPLNFVITEDACPEGVVARDVRASKEG